MVQGQPEVCSDPAAPPTASAWPRRGRRGGGTEGPLFCDLDSTTCKRTPFTGARLSTALLLPYCCVPERLFLRPACQPGQFSRPCPHALSSWTLQPPVNSRRGVCGQGCAVLLLRGAGVLGMTRRGGHWIGPRQSPSPESGPPASLPAHNSRAGFCGCSQDLTVVSSLPSASKHDGFSHLCSRGA